MKALFARILESRQGGTLLLALTYVLLGTVLRVGFLFASAGSVSWGLATFGALFVGFTFDLVMAWFLTLPLGLLSALWPARFWRFPLVVAWGFGAFLFTFWKISEILFWEEFGVRFNFIAVDYLVYTTEVVKNIKESYNLPLIIAVVLAVATGLFLLWRRLGFVRRWDEGAATDITPRWRNLAVLLAPLLAILLVAYFVGRRDLRAASTAHTSVGERLTAGLRHMGDPQPGWDNSYDTELAKNGEYAFLAAFWANQLEWKRFYPSRPDAVAQLRTTLVAQGGEPTTTDLNDITRRIRPAGRPDARRLNVIQITVESLSAEFLGCYGSPEYGAKNLTPNLDRISRESLWFSRCYAGGTRTVRGMEALTLSIPPIPGQSVLRRKGCEDLTTLGSVLRTQGYDTAFIYGGDGFFDNMNYFFGANGYRVVDLPRQEAAGKKATFGNAWGACDEDAFGWSLEEADKAHAAGKPFHHFVMTTSNHRPYTWPAGKIDPKLIDREGGVAYTDFAIGAFLKAAQAKPWFKDTVFVIVADHCASVAGKRELEIRKYEIPLFIWSPGNIAPRKFDTMMSQIDAAPTVLGLLGANYLSRFVGNDALSPSFRPRAFISNYQKVAVLRPDGLLTVLKPVRQAVQYQADLATGALTPLAAPDTAAVDEAIIHYQGTDDLFNHGGLQNPAR
ncbi:MAG: alkaline phosphatase family protein [Verrucomicrobia bacterium]|nr:alkaline phosphatase family protein [Verrucomicrobiota bacterium]